LRASRLGVHGQPALAPLPWVDEVLAAYRDIAADAPSCPTTSDGVVYKVNDLACSSDLAW